MSTSIKKIQSGLNEIIGEKVKPAFIKDYAHILGQSLILCKPQNWLQNDHII